MTCTIAHLIRRVMAALAVLLPLAGFAANAPAGEKPRRPANAVVVDEIKPTKATIDWGLRDAKTGDVLTTRREGGNTVTEYRQKGRLYKIKVQPPKGPPYFLVDERGEGKFTRLDGPVRRIDPPMWTLVEW